jgi:hypothetical protein
VTNTRPVVAARHPLASPPTHPSEPIQAQAASALAKATTPCQEENIRFVLITHYRPCGYPPVSGCSPVRHATLHDRYGQGCFVAASVAPDVAAIAL